MATKVIGNPFERAWRAYKMVIMAIGNPFEIENLVLIVIENLLLLIPTVRWQQLLYSKPINFDLHTVIIIKAAVNNVTIKIRTAIKLLTCLKSNEFGNQGYNTFI
jgi:hypothetical protein